MEDGELADRAQQLLDALDLLLRDRKFVTQLSAAKLRSIRAHRERVSKGLEVYRTLNLFTERRSSTRPFTVPSGPSQGMLVATAISAAWEAPAATEAAVATAAQGPGIFLIAGQILLPLAAAVMISELTGGSIQGNMARKLTDAVEAFARDLLELNALSLVIALTAAEAAKLGTVDLLDRLLKAVGNVLTIANILAELIKRYPGCAPLINNFKDAARKFNQRKSNPTLGGSRNHKLILEALDAMNAAYQDMLDCIVATRKSLRAAGKPVPP
jgi:hypothetical protein